MAVESNALARLLRRSTPNPLSFLVANCVTNSLANQVNLRCQASCARACRSIEETFVIGAISTQDCVIGSEASSRARIASITSSEARGAKRARNEYENERVGNRSTQLGLLRHPNVGTRSAILYLKTN